MLKIILEIEGTCSLQGVPNQNQDTANGHIITELLYHLRICVFFFVEFNHKAIFQGYMKYNVVQKYGVHNLVAVDPCATEMTRFSKNACPL